MTLSPPSPSPRLLAYLSRAKEGNPALALTKAEAAFTRLKSPPSSTFRPSPFVTTVPTPVRSTVPHFDVIVAGGTLGLLYATSLAARGWRVAVVERGPAKGRAQEWNASRVELEALVRECVLTREELETVIVTEFLEPGRIGFVERDGGVRELGVRGVLNIGVAPDLLIERVRGRFQELGGIVLEFCAVEGVGVGKDGVRVQFAEGAAMAVQGALGAGGTGLLEEEVVGEGREITGRVLVDAMGVFSPIAAQARGYRKPDGVCVTVGSCMKGPWTRNDTGDLIYSFQPINAERSTQYFWEAFPVGREPEARTTYMFSYGACDGNRQSLTEALEDYVETLPHYQTAKIDDLEVKRVLFGFFPSYFRDSPTDVAFDRVVPVGDAGGLQSPISFGGFGCCLRHLTRISTALDEALQQRDDSLLTKRKLQSLQWYLPSLSVSALFNKAMSVRPGQTTAGPFLDEFGINDILWSNMQAMATLGEAVQRPFLQDVITASGLTKTLAVMAVRNPALAVKMTAFLGPGELLNWTGHYFALISYAAGLPILKVLNAVLIKSNVLTAAQKFRLNRMIDAATYGSGRDAEDH